jgi:hypothetical protein
MAFQTADKAKTESETKSGLLAEPDTDMTAAGNQPPYDLRRNPFNYSLSNRFAPSGTIITRCVFHRTSTSDASLPTEMKPGARDIILRVDGSAKPYDVATFTPDQWQKHTF